MLFALCPLIPTPPRDLGPYVPEADFKTSVFCPLSSDICYLVNQSTLPFPGHLQAAPGIQGVVDVKLQFQIFQIIRKS